MKTGNHQIRHLSITINLFVCIFLFKFYKISFLGGNISWWEVSLVLNISGILSFHISDNDRPDYENVLLFVTDGKPTKGFREDGEIQIVDDHDFTPNGIRIRNNLFDQVREQVCIVLCYKTIELDLDKIRILVRRISLSVEVIAT